MNERNSIDQAFIRKLTEIIYTNLENENFGVDELAQASRMNRSTIFQRLQSIKGKSTTQFIREVRLLKAMEILKHELLTASEVAYRVGFGSPAYFNTCFHEYFGYPPGEIKKKGLTETDQDNDIDIIDDYIKAEKPLSSRLIHVIPVSGKTKTMVMIFLALLTLFSLIYFLNLFNLKESHIIEVPGIKKYHKSIAVLPFKNLTKNSDNQYFADGIMEDILNQLFRIKNLRVISRTSSEQFRDGGFSTREIARKLRTNYLLEGSVRRQETKVRISVQLIDARLDKHIWSANFDRELTNIVEVQNEIAIRVATELHAAISKLEFEQIGIIPTNNPQAYDNFLRGRFLLNKANSEQRVDINKEGLMASLKYFEKAIQGDPDFALAYAALANAWFNLSAWGWMKPYNTGIEKAKELSEKALKIDPKCAEAHAVKGAYLIWPERKFEEGKKELQLSLRLNPNYSFAHQAYAQLLMITGPIEEARVQMDRVAELEPYFWVVQNLNAWIFYFEGKHKEALEACRIARDLKPDYIFNNWLSFLNYAKLGEGENAVTELQIIAHRYTEASQFPDEIIRAYESNGINGLFRWLIDININKPIPASGMNGHPFYIAWWCAIIGEKEKSIYWLQKNMETPGRLYTYFNLIALNPDFDILRNDSRFLSIIDKIGLTPYNTRKPK